MAPRFTRLHPQSSLSLEHRSHVSMNSKRCHLLDFTWTYAHARRLSFSPPHLNAFRLTLTNYRPPSLHLSALLFRLRSSSPLPPRTPPRSRHSTLLNQVPYPLRLRFPHPHRFPFSCPSRPLCPPSLFTSFSFLPSTLPNCPHPFPHRSRPPSCLRPLRPPPPLSSRPRRRRPRYSSSSSASVSATYQRSSSSSVEVGRALKSCATPRSNTYESLAFIIIWGPEREIVLSYQLVQLFSVRFSESLLLVV